MVESGTEREPKMERSRKEGREENEDRLSALPDCILLHILTFMSTKDVVHTCVLSKRWKDLWKHVPALQLHSSKFLRVELFTKFVTKVLSCRDGSTTLRKVDFQRLGWIEPRILNRLVRYALSHNVQQLRIRAELVRGLEFLSTIFSHQSLTSLELSFSVRPLIFPKSLSLGALTNLHLTHVEFCPSEDGQAEPFLACKMLHTLVIEYFTVRNTQILCISNARLANLTMRSHLSDVGTCFKIILSTPNLQFLAVESRHPHELIGSNLSFLEEVYIDVSFCPLRMESALIVYSWFQAFTYVKSMTLSLSTLQGLSFIPYLRITQSPCFVNLNSLQVQTKGHVPALPSEIVDYLLQNSPSVEVTVIMMKVRGKSIFG